MKTLKLPSSTYLILLIRVADIHFIGESLGALHWKAALGRLQSRSNDHSCSSAERAAPYSSGNTIFSPISFQQCCFHNNSYYSQDMPRDYADIINSCWHDDPTQRPHFASLLEQLRDMTAAATVGSNCPGTRLTTSAASTASTANGSPGPCWACSWGKYFLLSWLKMIWSVLFVRIPIFQYSSAERFFCPYS